MNRQFRRLKRGAALATTVAIGLTPALVAAPAANATPAVPFTRIAGANRFGTAAAVAEKAFPNGAPTVIVATGFNFPDALAGNYLAGLDKAPILLVNIDNVPAETSAALQTLKTKNVVILGQTQAVDANTQSQLTSAGYNVTRIGGATRYDTMQMIDEVSGTSTTTGSSSTTGIGGGAIGTINGLKTALLARGDNFPDALGGGPVAYAKNFPVILTATTSLSPQAQAVIKDDGIQQIIILGGQAAIPTSVEQQANTAGAATLYRANGTDRSDTSRLLAEYELSNLGFVNTSYAIASGDQGYTGADALASGPFSGGFPQPTLVTDSIGNPGTLPQFGAAHNATETTCYAIGGPIPLPDSDVTAVCGATPASNQSFTVSPTTAATVNVNTVRQYTVSGLGTAPVDIQLFNCANVSVTNGSATFPNSTNAGGTGNFATQGTNTGKITVLNGSATANTGNQNGITPVSGQVTFSVTDANADCVTPVVFQQGAAGSATQNQIPLGTNNQPTVSFGVGGATTFIVPAAAGSLPATIGTGLSVTGVNPSADQFTTASGTFTYGASSDVYQIVTGGVCTTTTLAAFQSALSTGDTVSGSYNPPPAGPGSVFCVNDIAPAAPTGVTATAPSGTNAGLAGVQVNFSDSSTGTAVSYNVYRATATQPAITGQSVTCPTLTSAGSATSPQTPPAASSGYQKIGSVTDTTGTATYSFLDSTATVPPTATPTNPSYCYAVTTVDSSGQEGSPSAVAGPTTATAATAAAGAPKFASATANGTTTVTATYNQALTCSTVDTLGSDYSLTYTSGGVTFTDNPTGATCANSGTNGVGVVTLTVPTAPPVGSTVVITAKVGIDTNTVSNTATTPLFQASGDAVQTTAVSAVAPVFSGPAVAGVSSLAASANPTYVVATYNEAVNCNSLVAADYTITVTGNGSFTATYASCPGGVATGSSTTVDIGFAGGGALFIKSGSTGNITTNTAGAATATANGLVQPAGDSTTFTA